MPAPDKIFEQWQGVNDNDFCRIIGQTFQLPDNDKYVYRAEAFGETLSSIRLLIDTAKYKYKYQSHGQRIEVPPADIAAYTSIFSASNDTAKALKSFLANAKRGSPREIVAKYLLSQRIGDTKIPRSKNHVNPYYDLWVLSCQLTSFIGPLPDASYAHPANAKMTHPILPVFYHHFGCVVPSYDALYIISQLAGTCGGVIDMGSGNGYWTYMLRSMKIDTIAVDNLASEYRTLWIEDTIRMDGVEFLKKRSGGKGRILLMVYMITAGSFTKRLLQAYQGDIVVVVGTQNSNRYTGFSDCSTEEYFKREMLAWELTTKIAMPSFAGKDEGMFVWRKNSGPSILPQGA